jgi:hypothetical protein
MDEAGDNGPSKLNNENLNEAKQQVAEQLALRTGVPEVGRGDSDGPAVGSYFNLVRRVLAAEDYRPTNETFVANMADADPTAVRHNVGKCDDPSRVREAGRLERLSGTGDHIADCQPSPRKVRADQREILLAQAAEEQVAAVGLREPGHYG